MIRQRVASFVCGLLSVGVLLMCTSCGFSTCVVSDAEKPDVVLENFFTELKAENYEKCDQYLADNATFTVNNTSGYDFAEELIGYQLSYLKYKLAGETEFDGTSASHQVQINSPDMEYMIREMKQSIGSVEYAYLAEREEQSFDKENSRHVSDVISIAIEKYFEKSGQPEMLESVIDVTFKYQDGAWKIQVDEQLVAAIFGGTADE